MAFCSLSMYVYTPFSYAIALSIDGLSDSHLPQLKSLLLDEVKAKQNHTNHSNDIIILYNVNLIDGNNNNIKYNSTIIIKDSKIVDIVNKNDKNSVTKANLYKSYPNSNLIDLSDRYIIPGLFDMHAHVAGVLNNSFNKTLSEEILQRLLSYGITTVRNPGGPTEQSVDLKKDIDSAKLEGPQIFTAGRLLNSPLISIPFVEKKINSTSDVIEEVNYQAKAGVDFIKLYVGLSPELVKESIDKAHSLGIKVIGHLYLTNWTYAANSGIDFLTHGIPVSPYLLSEKNREIFEKYSNGAFDHFFWLKLVDINGKEINQMIDSLVKNNVYVDPTLSIYEAMLKDASSNEQSVWPKVLHLIKKMYNSGVKLLSGTDIPNFNLVAGKSLHHELELLADAGIPMSDVIQIATKNGAQSMGILNSTGTIEKGKQADMLVLLSNPIENISNTQKILMVINNGKVVDKTSYY
jgi:imidazolonepropionase-like amidohydrolase